MADKLRLKRNMCLLRFILFSVCVCVCVRVRHSQEPGISFSFRSGIHFVVILFDSFFFLSLAEIGMKKDLVSTIVLCAIYTDTQCVTVPLRHDKSFSLARSCSKQTEIVVSLQNICGKKDGFNSETGR